MATSVEMYESRAEALTSTVPGSVNVLITGGYDDAGDGGGAEYRRVASSPAHGFQSADGAWWEITDRVAGGRKVINPLAYGIKPGPADVTTATRAMYSGLSNARVEWPPGIFNLSDYIGVFGDNVETVGAGRYATTFRQHAWGRMVFTTSNPSDANVRPLGAEFRSFGAEAWHGSVACYYWDSFYGPGHAGATTYTVKADSTTTAQNVYVFKNNELLINGSDYTVSGYATSTLTITTATAHTSSDYVVIKVTNKDDLYSYPFTPLYGASRGTRGNQSAAVWHGGGNGFRVEDIHVEGFVAPVNCVGNRTSDAPGQQSYFAVIQDVSFNNCEFILCQELINSRVERIFGGKITESQTDRGVRDHNNPHGEIEPTYKDPHVLYWTNTETQPSMGIYVGVLEGDNKYSSNYKFRNVDGLVIEAGDVKEFHRVLDIEACNNVYGHFPLIRGAFPDHLDSQRSVLNLFGVKNATFVVDRMEVVDGPASVCRFRVGEIPSGVDGLRLSENCTVEIGELLTSGTSARSGDWVISHGGINCWTHVKHWTLDGADTGYMYRSRDPDNDLIPASGSVNGGIRVDRITLLTERTLKLAQISMGSGAQAKGVLIEYFKGKVEGEKVTYDSTTIINFGIDTKILADGFETLSFTPEPRFAMTGDAIFTVTASTAAATRQGEWIDFWCTVVFNVSAFTTASGIFQLGLKGLPNAASPIAIWPVNLSRFGGIDLGSAVRGVGARLHPDPAPSSPPYISLRANADDGAGSTIATDSFNPAGENGYVLEVNGRYRAVT